MFAAKYLVWLIILLPLLGGLYLVIFKPQDRQIQRRWTSLTLLGAGLAGLVRFILSGEAACTFQSSQASCLQAGVLALSVILLNGLMLYFSLVRDTNHSNDYQFYALVNAAWALTALANSWVISLGGLSLTLIVISRWVWNRGGSVGILVVRDDYKDDIGPKK
jgi:hypothetical protein